LSLGPPFDASGLGLQRGVGAVAVLALAGAVAWVLLLSGRSFGPGVIVSVEMRSTGPLRVGDSVRLAGRRIGEVRGARMAGAADRRAVEFEVFIERGWAKNVRANSEFFVSTPSVLGEAYLEIGPPLDGAQPGRPIADGDRVRGTDPPEIDRFLQYTEANVRVLLALLRETRPEADELLTAGDSLLTRLSGLPADRGQLVRIRDQAVEALDRGEALLATLRDAGAVPRTRKIVRELGEIADRAGPELRDLAAKAERSIARVEELGAMLGERRADLERGLAALRRTAEIGGRVAADVRELQRRVESGRGALGAFLLDRELFDDLHETHRILKSQPLRFLWRVTDKDKQ
jgi:phospholipid/cholesterol/gamma-HCH transport system substrate-binding protein